MKTIYTLVLGIAFSFSSLAQTKDSVYICVSTTAYAYHTVRGCMGLSKCTHKVQMVSYSDATTKYKRKLCGYCRKRQKSR